MGQLRDELGRILDAYDERRRGEIDREQKSRDEAASFLERFAVLRREVIRPVFEEAGELLEARGHRFGITEQEFGAGPSGPGSEALISLRIVSAGTRAPLHEDQRALTFATRSYNRTVWVNSGEASNAGGLAGAKGAYPLEKVTRQLVEEELTAFVARIVA